MSCVPHAVNVRAPTNTFEVMVQTRCTTVQVWDYAGDGYVHRLIQSHLDGKLVEVPSPEPHGAAARARLQAQGRLSAGAGGRSQKGGASAGGSAAGPLDSVDEERHYADDMNMMEVRPAARARQPSWRCGMQLECRGSDEVRSGWARSQAGAPLHR